MYVIGTAGHVDHGKSTLIRALTGIDPDRLREEKERQMTIDLGFAWLDLPSGREVGIVDVPGHRDFIENMLAGVGGIDAVLFIVAADEGVMPQTKEHLAIVDLLGIKTGIIVLTKIDLVDDEEWVEIVCEEIRTLVQPTSLTEAQIIPVSSTTGQGIDQLISAIDTLLALKSMKKDIGKPRLPVDRVFTLKGFGTVVTGTLLDGRMKAGQQMVILPDGYETRIRSIQTHKKHVDEAQPGTRTALNLVGVDVDQLRRGDVVAAPNTYSVTRRIDMRLRMLGDASKGLLHDENVKFFTGTTQTYARVRLIGADEISPGKEGWLQLEFKDEIVVSTGDHCILRRPSPPQTIGGGAVLDPHPPKRHKRFSPDTLKHFEILASGDLHQKILNILEKSSPIHFKVLLEQVDSTVEAVMDAIEKMENNEEVVRIKNDKPTSPDHSLLISREWFDRLKKQAFHALKNYHAAYPLRGGMKKDLLRSELQLSPSLFSSIINYLHKFQLIHFDQDFVRLPTHKIVFRENDRSMISSMMDRFNESPFTPPSFDELTQEFSEDLVLALIDLGELVRTSDQILFRKQEYQKMLGFTDHILTAEGAIEIGRLRDEFKTSRKYALSFLEYLDKIGYTERKDDIRVLKSG